VAQDIKVKDVVLKGYPPSSCKEYGYAINSDTLSILFEVTAAERYGLLFVANLVVDDTFRTVVSKCFETTLYQGFQTFNVKISENSTLAEDSLFKLLVAGRKIRLTNVFSGGITTKMPILPLRLPMWHATHIIISPKQSIAKKWPATERHPNANTIRKPSVYELLPNRN
jgi:hypothetical protein